MWQPTDLVRPFRLLKSDQGDDKLRDKDPGLLWLGFLSSNRKERSVKNLEAEVDLAAILYDSIEQE